MRRLAVLLAICLMVSAAACKRTAKHTAAAPELLSVVAMADPRAEAQFVRGFYSLEGNPWRWTAGHFTVVLRPPPDAARDGARLELQLNIPEVVFKEIGAVTLSATADQSPLAPEKFAQPGNHVYTRDVPPGALGGESVSLEFATDKAIPAGKVEQRELALIVTSVGLFAK